MKVGGNHGEVNRRSRKMDKDDEKHAVPEDGTVGRDDRG